VLRGVEFLRDVALGNPVTLPKKVIVIGGGNVAMTWLSVLSEKARRM